MRPNFLFLFLAIAATSVSAVQAFPVVPLRHFASRPPSHQEAMPKAGFGLSDNCYMIERDAARGGPDLMRVCD